MKTEEILERIEELEDWYEIREFISSLKLTPKQMEILDNHENKNVREGLAQNPNLTDDLMIKLSSDKKAYVRWGLAANPNLTEDLMIKLSSDDDDDVRLWLARNPNLISEVIIKQSSDISWKVSGISSKKLKSINSLSLEEAENAYDLIRMDKKHSNIKWIKIDFDYLAEKFPELSKILKMYKTILIKGV